MFVDAEADTGNIDIAAIESAITTNTKAIVVVHFLGMPVDMIPVVALARKHKLFVMEDCALAIGRASTASTRGCTVTWAYFPFTRSSI